MYSVHDHLSFKHLIYYTNHMKKNKHITQATKKKIYLILFVIWLIASAYIAYQAQFIGGYLVHVRGMTQEEYQYPLEHVQMLCGFLGLLILNEAYLITSELSYKHPIFFYFICSIAPLFLSAIAVFSAMHAADYLISFILLVLFISLFHFLILPFLLVKFHKIIHKKY